MRPVLLLQTASLRVMKMSSGDLGWVETRTIILQSHFPGRFLEIRRTCGSSVMKMKLWVLCVCVHECRGVCERNSVTGTIAFVSLGTDALLFFELVGPLTVPQQKALIRNGMVTIRYFIYDKVL